MRLVTQHVFPHADELDVVEHAVHRVAINEPQHVAMGNRTELVGP